MPPNGDDIIRASEVGQYAYCARAWWLNRVKGYQPADGMALKRGRAGHRAHGRAVLGYRRLQGLAVTLLLLALAALVAYFVVSLGH